MTVRRYSSISIDTTLATGIGTSDTTITVVTGTGSTLMGGVTLVAGDQFTVTLDPDTVNEEVVFITAQSGDTFTITRARAGTTAVAHAAGAGVRHVLSSDDLIAFENTNLTALTASNVAVVTNKDLSSVTNTFPNSLATLTGSQTLTNKTINAANNTLIGIPSGAFNGASVYNSSNFSISSGATTELTWNSEAFDTNNYHSTSTNTGRLTVPTTGYYRVNASIIWLTLTTSNVRTLALYKNGSSVKENQTTQSVSGSTLCQTIDSIFYLNANDYISVYVTNNDTVTGTIYGADRNSWAQIQYLGS